MKWMSFADVRAKLAQAIETSQEQDVVILVRGKPAARLVGVEGQTIEDLVRSEQEVVHLLHERQRNPGKSIPLEEVEARIQKRIDAEAKAKPAARRGSRAAAAPRRARRAR